jgi:D-beta-D-heptose 7-phosphate kinase/D-beta-D-heptose 1-phosphate adenosyltransferase
MVQGRTLVLLEHNNLFIFKFSIKKMSKSRGIQEKIKSFEELLSLLPSIRERGTIVWTNGCFDIIHKGHIRHLFESSRFGDYLIVGLNSDSSVRALKGPDKPKMPEEERAEIVSAIGCVDYVLIFPEIDTTRYLSAFHPNVYAKGGEYALDTINQEERRIVESYRGRIAFTGDKVNSSTEVIERIRGQ